MVGNAFVMCLKERHCIRLTITLQAQIYMGMLEMMEFLGPRHSEHWALLILSSRTDLQPIGCKLQKGKQQVKIMILIPNGQRFGLQFQMLRCHLLGKIEQVLLVTQKYL